MTKQQKIVVVLLLIALVLIVGGVLLLRSQLTGEIARIEKVRERNAQPFEIPEPLDADQDGLTDQLELILGTDPTKPDDPAEVLAADEQYTIPEPVDSDQNGISDDLEEVLRLVAEEQQRAGGESVSVTTSGETVIVDPFAAAPEYTIPEPEDSDGDGLPNYLELVLGFDPQNPDSDGDGISDIDDVP